MNARERPASRPEQPPPIPDYEMLRPIGRGAYGEVWLARSVTGIHRAVKIVRRASFDDERPFEREFEGIRRFEPVSAGQESQVGLLHVGRNDTEGFFYYVLELADDVETGEEIYPEKYVPKTLKELRARRQRLPADECLTIGLALSRALVHLHHHGLVHRDIKPSNVIFVHGVPKLADIGLVSTIDSSHSIVGTEGFVPPEGSGAAAADVYSLGKVLYEISTGLDRRDFPQLPDDFESLPDKRAWLELNEVVLRACEADAQRRYSSAPEMHEDLLLLQAGRSVRRLRVMERRFALVAKYGIAATIITALAVGGFLWSSAQTRQARLNLQRAERAEADAVERLQESRLSWVHANRYTGRPGRRYDSLAELAKAAARTNSLELRNEAIACLGLPDLRPQKAWAKTPRWDSFHFNATFELYGTNDASGNLTIRNAANDAVRFEIPTRGAPLTAALSSRNDRWIATSDTSGRAWLWEVTTSTARPIEFPPRAQLCAFTPDSDALVVKHPDGWLHFVSCRTGVEQRSIPGPTNLARLHFNSAGDRYLALAGRRVLVSEARDGKIVQTLELPAHVECATWHPDGRRFVAAWTTRIGLWDADSGRQLRMFEGNEGLVVGLAFHPTGEWLASASWDHATRLWETDTAHEVLRATGSGSGLQFSADGRQLAFQTWGNDSVQVYEFADIRAVHRYTLPEPRRTSTHYTVEPGFSTDGRLVAAPDRDGVYIYQPPRPEPVAFLPGAFACGARFTPDGQALLTAGSEGVRRWPLAWSDDNTVLQIGPPQGVLPPSDEKVGVFDISPDGRWISATRDRSTAILELDQFGSTNRGGLTLRPARPVYLGPDGRVAATVASRRTNGVSIWSPTSGAVVTNLPVASVRHVAFSADGRWMACAADDTTTVWRTRDWTLAHRIQHARDAPGRYRVAFSPDSRLLADTISDQATQLLVVETAEVLGTLSTDRLLTSLGFSPDGAQLAVTFESGYFQLWDLRHLRQQLAGMGLDWPGPALPPAAAEPAPFRVTAVLKDPATPAPSASPDNRR